MTRKPLTVVDVTKLNPYQLAVLYEAGFDVPWTDAVWMLQLSRSTGITGSQIDPRPVVQQAPDAR